VAVGVLIQDRGRPERDAGFNSSEREELGEDGSIWPEAISGSYES
jgi:hypothetical protein